MRVIFLKCFVFMGVVFIICLPLLASAENHFSLPQLSRVSCDFIGTININGAPANPGDEIAFFDSQGVLCGFSQIIHQGEYGVLHVYGDDPLTLEIDEGAEPGDVLEIRLWDASESKEIAGFSVEYFAGNPLPTSSYQTSHIPPIWESQKAFVLNIDTRSYIEKPKHSPLVCNFIGHISINGLPAAIGDEIAVYDPEGNICAHTRLSTPGQYGILQVYGDDQQTKEKDEGAQPFDQLSFAVYDSLHRVWLESTHVQFSPSQAIGSFTSSTIPPVWQTSQAYALDISVNYQYQHVSLYPAYATQKANQSFTLSINYTTSDQNTNMGGLGIRIHFDSTRFTYQHLQNIFQKGLIPPADVPQKDEQDLDDNPFTDQYIHIQWSDTSWPDASLPLKVADISFFTQKTARPGASDIGISFITADNNYQTSYLPAVIIVDNPPATLYGNILYSGTSTGPFYIAAWKSTDWHQWQTVPPERIYASVNGKFTLRLIPDHYIIGAFRDHDENSSYLSFLFDPHEPYGFFNNSALPGDQNKLPETVVLESDEIIQSFFYIYDWPVIDQVMMRNEYFAENSIFEKGKALFAQAEIYHRPESYNIQSVTISNPLMTTPKILKDNGSFPDSFIKDRIFTIRTSVTPSDTDTSYTILALANDLMAFERISLSPTYIDPPIIILPKEISTADPVFEWQQVPGIDTYGLYIFSTDKPTFPSDKIYTKKISGSNQYQLSSEELNLNTNEIYYFYISAETRDQLSMSYSNIKSFVIDTDPPAITQVMLSPESPVKAGPLNITIMYNERVNTEIEPNIQVKNMNIVFSGNYINEQMWCGQCTVQDDQDGYKVLHISNVNDIAGNVMPENNEYTFYVDTHKPKIVSVIPYQPVKEGNIDVYIRFNEPMNIDKIPLVTFGEPPKPITVIFSSENICRGSYYITSGYDGIQTINVSKGFDKANNQMEIDQTHTFKVDTTAPSAPTQLSGLQLGLTLELGWKLNPEPDMASYQIYEDGKKIDKVSHPQIKHTELMISGKTYAFHVTAIDRLGHESGLSKPFFITTQSIPPMITFPAQGQILVDPKTIVKGKAEFATNVQTYINGNISNSGFANTRGEFTILDIPLISGTNEIAASSINSNDVASAVSTPITFTFDPKPLAPQGLVAIPGDTTVILQWEINTETDIKGYHVYRFNKRYNETLLTETNYKDVLLTNGMPYIYHVSAVDYNGSEGAKSEPVQVTPITGFNW